MIDSLPNDKMFGVSTLKAFVDDKIRKFFSKGSKQCREKKKKNNSLSVFSSFSTNGFESLPSWCRLKSEMCDKCRNYLFKTQNVESRLTLHNNGHILACCPICPMLDTHNLTHYHTMQHFEAPKIYSCKKHCKKRRNCLLQAISPFITMFSTLYGTYF